MKKLFLTSAIVLGSLTFCAATPVALIQHGNEVRVNENFKEIKVSEVPKAVTDAVSNDFAGATITKAYVNDEKEYKLELELDGAMETVYANASGEWIKK
ncbi:hypothetical protein [Formosa haliotis]|uniref:hypothetical protein n=1 Tax=Formosa haliotis TaxID=1555194 RepID=UPI000826ACAF|nr:hypothetical protein [Formosa haliotis]